MSVHHIDVVVQEGLGEEEWRFTGFYGWPETQNRHLSWQLLKTLASQPTLSWMCMGDFNEILFAHEKKGGNERADWQMTNFREAVDVCGFIDISFSGYEFTYDNGREEGDNIQCRLDRALAITEWVTIFPDSDLWHIEREWSDHAPIKLSLWNAEDRGGLGSKPFRFEQIWATESSCESVIENAWRSGITLKEKLEGCAGDLREWGAKKFGPVFKALKKKRRALARLNKGGLSARQVEQRRYLLREISELITLEERYWKQRSRVLWLEGGDRNSKFFYQRASRRHKKNTIKLIHDDDGREHRGDEVVGKIAVEYFRELFTTSNPTLIQ